MTWIAEIGDTDVSIEEFNQNQSFTIYPNPINSNATLYFESKAIGEIKEIKMTDLNGKLILLETNKANHSIQIPNVEKGIYFITILTKNNNYETYKILVH